ncbi:hypothetical protein GLI01_11840 [Gluconacetobacter liquefaciens]|uniref:DUF3649 domain-containing protein n=1 Tax=Gluconacetobacter liquefaciens TaxID=89584 RepID=A0A370G1G0_GLULI|nr:hypothetical protein [Gluconacetobacter liquefaciens]MBB2186962.1 hypothetical protein [Gluconacetobacter liquefaciens]RDI37618.1 hypothetical protein C7453_10525 [Gluconacetobacter liquefaciens]GBR12083.1 hypothetical protein AA0522_2515 [Gluconacetobacter liquefaciens NRIC 0522]GEB37149.1 hypothetical protein GLI01_11840 [Gluconacetobacter liquefaciens]
MRRARLDNRQWVAKLAAGIVPGCALALGVMAVVGGLCHTTGSPMTLSAQLLLWLAGLLWAVILSACFLFRSGSRAWGVLGGGAVAFWLLFALLKSVFP